LLDFLAAGHLEAPVWKIIPAHDRKSAAAPTAIIVHSMWFHFPELWAYFTDYFALWFDYAHQTHHIAGIMQECHGTLPRNIQIAS